ncbi:transcription factor bHLH114-like [Phalaenopsis equestris]|uniref:transcription factor bHLH114-like n=1 Tax=Phalaenopsis equestris TaxID=78828 RepID=UPI0009E46C7B|nr:transcription factor bHLH114-like [Phalaenopsis equestris]
MLRFFEPDANTRWLAPNPPPPPQRTTSSAVPAEYPALTARRTSSLPATVNLVKDRWHPSHSVKNAFSGCGGGDGGGGNSWQDSGVFRRQACTDPFLEKLQGGRSSSMAAENRGKSNRHEEMMEDWRKRGSTVHEEESKKMGDHKRQKINGDENLFFLPSFDPVISSSSRMRATISQTVKEPVKNQKLGDKITALQQLVSPFGKTDTASVLQEATIYIKALHEQINFQILSRRRFETSSSGNNIQVQISASIGNVDVGRSRLYEWGLCIIPVSSAVANFANQECPDHPMRELMNQLN